MIATDWQILQHSRCEMQHSRLNSGEETEDTERQFEYSSITQKDVVK